MKHQYILLGGDKPGANAVDPNSNVSKLKHATSRYWGLWASSAQLISEFWSIGTTEQHQHFLQQLCEQGKIGLANKGEDAVSKEDVAWWLQWLEWESLGQ